MVRQPPRYPDICDRNLAEAKACNRSAQRSINWGFLSAVDMANLNKHGPYSDMNIVARLAFRVCVASAKIEAGENVMVELSEKALGQAAKILKSRKTLGFSENPKDLELLRKASGRLERYAKANRLKDPKKAYDLFGVVESFLDDDSPKLAGIFDSMHRAALVCDSNKEHSYSRFSDLLGRIEARANPEFSLLGAKVAVARANVVETDLQKRWRLADGMER